MLKIRLRRVGGKKQPSYRLVVTDIGAPRDGAFVSVIGSYNPLTNPETVVVNEEKALDWLRKGAQPSDTAARLLAKLGITQKLKPVEGKAITPVEEKPITPVEEKA